MRPQFVEEFLGRLAHETARQPVAGGIQSGPDFSQGVHAADYTKAAFRLCDRRGRRGYSVTASPVVAECRPSPCRLAWRLAAAASEATCSALS